MAVLTGNLLRTGLGNLVRSVLEPTCPAASVSRITWERCDVESSYDTYCATVSFRDRSDLRWFLKDYGSSRRPQDEMERRRERELHVYRRLLDPAVLDTARFHGCVRDRSRGQFWLVLEFVDGVPLVHADVACWPHAAAWLARLHGYVARHPERLDTGGLLVEHDAAFFHATAERALRSVLAVLPAQAAAFSAMLRRYERLAETMANQERTLVHGAYRPSQILLDVSRPVPRVCPVDWELAAVGARFHDLASLVDGIQPPRLDHMLDAYRAEALRHDLHVPPPAELKDLIDAFRLHRLFTWLSKAVAREYPERAVHKLATMTRDVAASVFAS